MSGGIAYVLDESGDFTEKRCNPAMVDIEEVSETRDQQALKDLIFKHAELTESPRARWILDNWETMLPKFLKIFPHEFKRVLGIPRKAQAASAGVIAGGKTETRQVLHG